jgi:D-glycerate 3-kinase
MTEEQVNHFVDGCPYLPLLNHRLFRADHFSIADYPSYELFTETLREGVFKPHNSSADTSDCQGRQLRLVVNRDRRVQEVIQI